MKETKPYNVTTRLNSETVNFRAPLDDPFVRHTLVISLKDLIKSLFKGKAVVEVIIDADSMTIQKVLGIHRENRIVRTEYESNIS